MTGIHSMRLEAASKAKVAVNLHYIERTFRAGQGSETALSHSAGRQSVASCSCQNTLAGFFPALTCEKLEVKRERVGATWRVRVGTSEEG